MRRCLHWAAQMKLHHWHSPSALARAVMAQRSRDTVSILAVGWCRCWSWWFSFEKKLNTNRQVRDSVGILGEERSQEEHVRSKEIHHQPAEEWSSLRLSHLQSVDFLYEDAQPEKTAALIYTDWCPEMCLRSPYMFISCYFLSWPVFLVHKSKCSTGPVGGF